MVVGAVSATHGAAGRHVNLGSRGDLTTSSGQPRQQVQLRDGDCCSEATSGYSDVDDKVDTTLDGSYDAASEQRTVLTDNLNTAVTEQRAIW